MSSNTNPEPSTAEAKAVDYTKLIPFVSAGLILLGVTKLMLYYGLFGINILSFLEFGEIITSFLDTAVAFVLGILTTALLYLSTSIKSQKRNVSLSVPKKNNEGAVTEREILIAELETQREKQKHLKKSQNAAIIVLSIAAVILISLLYKNLELLLFYFIGLTIMVLIMGIIFKIQQKHDSKLIKDLCLIAIVFTASELLTINMTINDYKSVKTSRNLGTNIVFNNDTYLKDSSHAFISDSSNYYIGQTNKYIFIYHLKEGITSVLPISSVVQMDFKKVKPQTWIGKLFQ